MEKDSDSIARTRDSANGSFGRNASSSCVKGLCFGSLWFLGASLGIGLAPMSLGSPVAGEPEPVMEPKTEIRQPGPMDFFIGLTRNQLATSGFERFEEQIHGQTIVGWQKGEGPTVVMIHGVADQAGTWFQVAPALAETYRVLLIDLPGHGESEPKDGPLKMSLVLQGLEGFLEKHLSSSPPSKPAVLVGNSMGAWLSAIVAHRRPDWIRAAILVNGGPIRPDTGDLDLMPSDREQARRLMAALRDPASPPIPDAVLDDLVRRAEHGQVSRMLAETEDLESHLLDGRLGEIKTPVHLLWGASDRYMGSEYPDRLLAGLTDARMTRIPKCGHLPQAECPANFLEALQNILQEVHKPDHAAPDPNHDKP